MKKNLHSQHHTLAWVSEQLGKYNPQKKLAVDKTQAAVAAILRDTINGAELLFIERAASERDPWSGHIAFPGGKVESGETPKFTAERETMEETGVNLSKARYLGRLADIIGSNLPIQVSCFTYSSDAELPVITPNEEVRDTFWVALADLQDSRRHITATVGFNGNSMKVPAIELPQSDKPVLWGITYRLVMQMLEIINSKDPAGLHFDEIIVH